jgi:hypothetical protein
MRLTKKLVQYALSEDSWSLGNQVLYDLCRRYPEHVVDAEIVAKVWLIGRTYSASVERGRGKAAHSELSNDRFYTEVVPHALRKSRLDSKLKALAKFNETDKSTAAAVLDTHAHLVRLFYNLTRKRKRALASKYLHFHRPDLFFIYDSRALSSIRALGVLSYDIDMPRGVDRPYAQFVSAAIGVREHVLSRFGQKLTPRQLDRLLLATHESPDV